MTERDRFVERALRTLQAPEPGPEFWAQVESSLGPNGGTRRTWPWWAAAAAAIVLLAASVLGASQIVSEPDAVKPAGPAEDPPSAAAQVVLDFVDALGAGDEAAARRKLGPRSEAVADQFLGSAASEGFGTWSAATDRQTRVIALPDAGTVVVLVGTVEQEGVRGYRSDAFPVVKAESADAWFVEPWAFGSGGVDNQITLGVERITVPATADVAYVSINGAGARPAAIQADRTLQYDFEDGDLVVVIALGDDGLFDAVAFTPARSRPA